MSTKLIKSLTKLNKLLAQVNNHSRFVHSSNKFRGWKKIKMSTLLPKYILLYSKWQRMVAIYYLHFDEKHKRPTAERNQMKNNAGFWSIWVFYWRNGLKGFYRKWWYSDDRLVYFWDIVYKWESRRDLLYLSFSSRQ